MSEGIAMSARIPMIRITTSSSTSVKPCWSRITRRNRIRSFHQPSGRGVRFRASARSALWGPYRLAIPSRLAWPRIPGHLSRSVRSPSVPPPEPQNEHDPALAPSTAELDLLESGRPRLAGRSQPRVRPPQVELGKLTEQGIAPAIMAIVERGVRRRPALARDMSAEIELVLEERYPPVRIV